MGKALIMVWNSAIQELANPLVSSAMVFVPETDRGVAVNRLAQSQKWREGFSRELRVPMVRVRNQHFYVYEPAQLEDKRVVLPVFFYQKSSVVHAKCLQVTLEPSSLFNHNIMMVQEEPQFDSSHFIDVDVEEFSVSFVEMVLGDGRKWVNCPHVVLHRECAFILFCL